MCMYVSRNFSLIDGVQTWNTVIYNAFYCKHEVTICTHGTERLSTKKNANSKKKKLNYIIVYVDINFVYNNPSETYHGVGPGWF